MKNRLKLEYIKAYRNAYGERMTEAQEQQLERRLTKLVRWTAIGTVYFSRVPGVLHHT